MTPEEDVYLSVYLDGELAPGPRSRVDDALLEQGPVAERLRDLRAVHDLVAGLSRPGAAADASAPVLAEIARRRSLFARFALFETSPVFRGLSLFASAAALVVCAALGLSWTTSVLNGRGETFRVQGLWVRAKDHTGPEPGQRRSQADEGEGARRSGDNGVVNSALRPGPAERALDADLLTVRDLFDGETSDHALVIRGGAADSAWVQEYLAKAPRRNDRFGRLTVAPGVVVGPPLSQGGIVYAVRLDDTEARLLKRELKKEFGDRLSETPLGPEVVTRLAGCDGAASRAGTPVAKVLLPDLVASALLARPDPPAIDGPLAARNGVAAPPEPGPPAPGAEAALPPEGGPGDGEAGGPAFEVVLIWVEGAGAP